MICVNTRQVSIKREKKKIYIPLKRTKKEKKESKMKINTELVGEKVPENKSCPPFFSGFLQGLLFNSGPDIYSKPNQIRIHDVLLYSFFLCLVD